MDRFVKKWVSACLWGIVFGIGVAAILAYFYFFYYGSPSNYTEYSIFISTLVVGGALEGLITASFQYRVIRLRYPGLRYGRWTGYTIIAAIIGWLVGVVPSFFIQPEEAINYQSYSFLIMIGLNCIFGLGLGVLFGFFQWLELRRCTIQGYRWITANALGWMIAIVVIFVTATIPQPTTSIYLIIVLGIFAAALSGAVIGLITGHYIVNKLHPKLG